MEKSTAKHISFWLLLLIFTIHSFSCRKETPLAPTEPQTGSIVGATFAIDAIIVKTTSVILKAKINPEGLALKYYYQYGISETLTDSTNMKNLRADTTYIMISDTIRNLTRDTRYYFRVVWIDNENRILGSIADFSTSKGREFIYPTAIGTIWQYLSHYYSYSGSAGNSMRNIDGLHTWEVISSTQNDSAISFTIRDIRKDTIHYRGSAGGGWDTTYVTTDTIQFPLIQTKDFYTFTFPRNGPYPVKLSVPRFHDFETDTIYVVDCLFRNNMGLAAMNDPLCCGINGWSESLILTEIKNPEMIFK